MRKAYILLFTVLLGGYNIKAQDCALNLRNAEALFESGQVEEVPPLLQSCLESGFTDAEEISAYKLIIRSYLFDDKRDKAEQMMLQFLKKNPEYEISPADNEDFIYLFNKFRVKPVIQLGLKAGMSYTYITGKNEQSVSGSQEGTKYNNNNFTLGLGAMVRYRFNERIEAGLELDYSELSFSYREDFLSYGVVNYSEKQRRLEGVAYLYYQPWQFGGFVPYFKAGAGIAYKLSATGSVVFNNSDVNNPFERAGPETSRNESRIAADILGAAGFGCKYKLPSGYAFIDIDTRFGTMNQYLPGIPGDNELYYFFKDDRFRLNLSRISVGYIYIFYKPERIEE